MIVKTRRGVHAYWVLRETIVRNKGESTNSFKDRFQEVQCRLINYFESCTGVKLLCQHMRLPTFNDSEIVEINAELMYTQEQLICRV